MTEGSIQLRAYLRARRAGCQTENAAAQAGLSLAEARLTDADEAKGLLKHIDTETPHLDLSQSTAPAAAMSTLRESVNAGRDGAHAVPAKDGPGALQPEEKTMARRAKSGDGGNDRRGVTNLTETKEVIREAVAKILTLKNERKELNAAIGEQRARVKNYGVPPAALDLALRMKEADPEDRQLHDEGYAIARDALGLGIQASLFETLGTSDDGEAKPKTRSDAMAAAREHLGGKGAAPDALAA